MMSINDSDDGRGDSCLLTRGRHNCAQRMASSAVSALSCELDVSLTINERS
jgi:hypothetical protein